LKPKKDRNRGVASRGNVLGSGEWVWKEKEKGRCINKKGGRVQEMVKGESSIVVLGDRWREALGG